MEPVLTRSTPPDGDDVQEVPSCALTATLCGSMILVQPEVCSASMNSRSHLGALPVMPIPPHQAPARSAPAFRRYAWLSLIASLATCLLSLAPTTTASADDYFDINGASAGFGSPSGTYSASGSYWSTSSAGTSSTGAFDSSGVSMDFGATGSDFAGDNFTLTIDFGGNVPWTGVNIASSSATVTFAGSTNFYLAGPSTWTVAAGSTFNEGEAWDNNYIGTYHNYGMNFNQQSVTLQGGGTINFTTAIGNNGTNPITENDSNLVVNLLAAATSDTGYFSQSSYYLQNGTLNFANAAAANAFNNMRTNESATFTLAGGTIDNTSGSDMTLGLYQGVYQIGGNFTFNGSNNLDFGTYDVTLTTSPTITVNANTLAIGGVINDGGNGYGLTLAGNGTLALYGQGTFTGASAVNGGVLSLQNATYLSSTSVAIASGAVLEYNVPSGTVYQPTLTITGGGTLRSTGASDLVFGGNGDVNWDMSAGSLIDIEAGVFFGGHSVQDVWTSNLSSMNIASGAYFFGVEANVMIDALTGAGAFTGGYTPAWAGYVCDTIGVNNGSGTFSGLVEDSDGSDFMNLVKVGSGTQRFTGTLTYSGTTTVSGGFMLIDGNGSAAAGGVTVASGATFGGTGSIGGPVTVSSGGTIAPGDGSPGTFTIGASGTALDLSAGSNTCAMALGTASDLIACSGSGSNVLLGGALTVTNAGGFTAGTYTLMTFTGSASGSFSSVSLPSGFSGYVSLDNAGGHVYLIVSVETMYWSSSSGGTNWSDSSWGVVSGGPYNLPWSNGSQVVFEGSAGTVNVDVNASCTSITFTTAGYTLSGSDTLTLIGSGGNITPTGTNIISAAIAGSVGLTMNGSGTIALSGANTYTGATTISTGTIVLGGSSLPSTTALLIATGATLDLGAQSATVASLANSGGGGGTVTNSNASPATLTVGGSATTSFSGTIINGTGAVNLTMNGSGSLTLTGANTYSGTTLVAAGTLTVASGGSLIGTLSLITSNGTFILDSGTVTLSTSSSGIFGVGYGGGTGTVTVNSGGTLNVGNGGGRTFIGGGASGGPYGTGIFNLEGGTVNVGASGSFPNDQVYLDGYGGSSTVNLDSGTLSLARPIVDGNGGSTVYFNGATLVCGVTSDIFDNCNNLYVRAGGMIVNVGPSYTATINSDINHYSPDGGTDGGITKLGSGTLVDNSNNPNFTGSTIVSAGILSFYVSLSSGNTPNYCTYSDIASGAVLEFNMDFPSSYYEGVNPGTFTGAGTLRKTGAGELLFGFGGYPDNYFAMSSGSTIDVEVGVFTGGNDVMDVWTSNLSSLNIASGAIFQGVEANVRVDALTGSGTFAGGYAGAGYVCDTFGVNNGSGTFSGTIANYNGYTCNIVKTGTGTQHLTGTLSYTGTTTVSGGSLMDDASGSSATGTVTVQSGATFGGTGSIGGHVIVSSGGTISPGDGSTGTLTIGAGGTALDLSAGSNTCAMALGTSSDLIACTGSGANIILGGTLVITNAGGFTSGTYTLMTFTGGSSSGSFSSVTLPSGYIGTVTINNGSNLVQLTVATPAILTRQTQDLNGDGYLDNILITTNTPLNDNFTGLVATVTGYAVTGFAAGPSNNQFYIQLTQLVTPDTGATPVMQITANTTLAASSGGALLPVDGSGVTTTDDAAPVLMSCMWTDGGAAGVGSGDMLALTFSESVTATSLGPADLGLPVTGDTLSTTGAVTQTGSTITLTLAGTPVLCPGGTYSSGTVSAGSPSGIYIGTPGVIADGVGLHPVVGSASSAVDIGPTSTTVAIAWTVASDPQTWPLSTIAVGSTASTHSDGSLNTQFINAGNCTINVSIATSDTGPTNAWTPAGSAGSNTFLLKADNSSGASTSSGGPLIPGNYAVTAGTSPTSLFTGVDSGVTSTFALFFQAPTSISSGSGTPYTIAITFTAAVDP